MKILVIYPTPFEAGAFFKKYVGKKPAVGMRAAANIGRNQINVFVSGYGCKASAERVKSVGADIDPDLTLLCGFCGSCSPDISKCDYLYETDSPELKAAFEEMGAAEVKIACSEVFAGYEEKCRLFKEGFSAVDMESALFINIFGSDKFGSFRCVSDELKSNVPEDFFHLLIDKDTGGDKPLAGALIKLLFNSPRDFLKLISFANGSRKMKADYDAKALKLLERLGEIKSENEE